MATNKTIETAVSVEDFLSTIGDESRRRDFQKLVEVITSLTRLEPVMWGAAIVGFGRYHYHYESGREGDAPLIGISPRANCFALYLSSELENREELLSKLGKHKTGKGCIHIQTLTDINIEVLGQLVVNSVASRLNRHSL